MFNQHWISVDSTSWRWINVDAVLTALWESMQRCWFYALAVVWGAWSGSTLFAKNNTILLNQLLQLCTARVVWSDSIISPVSIRSGKCTIQMVTKKLNGPITRCFSKTHKSWIDYRALTKTGLSANINGPCNKPNVPKLVNGLAQFMRLEDSIGLKRINNKLRKTRELTHSWSWSQVVLSSWGVRRRMLFPHAEQLKVGSPLLSCKIKTRTCLTVAEKNSWKSLLSLQVIHAGLES